MGMKKSESSLPSEKRKRQVDEHEIEQIKDGMPKVREYWNMVNIELTESGFVISIDKARDLT
jgi:hypothetical protein